MRVRKHVNPFQFFKELNPLKLNELFPKDQPLNLEIGSETGSFLLEYAKTKPDQNFLGVEIRTPHVEALDQKIKDQNIQNVRIINANANEHLIKILPPDSISDIYVFFADPWFKKRHVKRRVINQKMLSDFKVLQKKSRNLYIQTDVEALMIYMHKEILDSNIYQPLYTDIYELKENPLKVMTDYEKKTISYNDPVYRMVYKKVI